MNYGIIFGSSPSQSEGFTSFSSGINFSSTQFEGLICFGSGIKRGGKIEASNNGIGYL